MAWPQAPRQLGKPLPGLEGGGVQGCSAVVPGELCCTARLGERLAGCVPEGGSLSVKAAGSRLGSDSAVVLAGPVFPLGAAGHLGRRFTVLLVSLSVGFHYHHRGRQAVMSVCPVTRVTSVPA